MDKLLKIITGNDPKLRVKCRKVDDVKADKVQKLIRNMVKTMIENKGVGLSAPQVGSDLRIIVAGVDNQIYCLVNPEIKSKSRKKSLFQEGCLSFPGKFIPIERPESIKVRALDAQGNKIKIKAKSLLARVIQHEVDHLDGILIIDKRK